MQYGNKPLFLDFKWLPDNLLYKFQEKNDSKTQRSYTVIRICQENWWRKIDTVLMLDNPSSSVKGWWSTSFQFISISANIQLQQLDIVLLYVQWSWRLHANILSLPSPQPDFYRLQPSWTLFASPIQDKHYFAQVLKITSFHFPNDKDPDKIISHKICIYLFQVVFFKISMH